MTTFNVEEFRTRLGAGGARPNQYRVILGIPAVAPDLLSVTQAAFLCSASTLPGQTIPPATVLYRGRAVHMAGDRVFNPWATTILNDTGFTVRTWIERWMNAIEDAQTKVGSTVPTTYYADMRVEQLDRNGAVLKAYDIFGAFPTDLSDVPLSYAANDQISEFSCTWQYQSFRPADVVGAAGAIGVGVAAGIGAAFGGLA